MSVENNGIDPSVWDELTTSEYDSWYKQSISNPKAFWETQAKKFITWDKPFSNVCEQDFIKGKVEWFKDAQLNVCYNCIDRHLEKNAQKTAIIWEPDEPDQQHQVITYQQLHDRVAQFANVLKKYGVSKGSRVCIYMPMIPEATIAMLACARIGAVHSVVFGGFSPNSLSHRIEDAQATVVITADAGMRGGKQINLKSQVDVALKNAPSVEHVLVVQNFGEPVDMIDGRDHWFLEEADSQPTTCPSQIMDAEDPLFILYTSGSTGNPKGVLHTQGGYITYAAMTFRYVFDYKPDDIFWCTADVGWVTGHTYMVYGPLALGATIVMFEGVPNYPTPSRCWEVIDKHKVSIFYTAPTAIRALMAQGDEYVKDASLSSLRVLGTVGEPINPEAWRWYHQMIGKSKLPIVDTWWQTETGGILLAPLINISKQKPGSAGLPFFGVEPKIIDEHGKEVERPKEGNLCIAGAWPGIMRTIYNDHPRFMKTYFSQAQGLYFTGDGAYQDEDGEYWITGRIDDVINVSGHRLGTAEIEGALVLHPNVAEAAVVGVPDDIKGQNIYAFVTLTRGSQPSGPLIRELKDHVKEVIGKIAAPAIIQWAPHLPKTRSGKILRRILRKIAKSDFDTIGDTSTLSDSNVIEELIGDKKAIQSTTQV